MINRVSRLRNTVRRPTVFWSQAVHGLLRAWRALASRPRAYCTPDNGEHGTETLTWIEGAPGADGRADVVPGTGPRQGTVPAPHHGTVIGYRLPATSVRSSGQRTSRPARSSGTATSAREIGMTGRQDSRVIA